MKTYPKMKDSGVEWIGEIPEDWKVYPVKHFLKIPVSDGPHETPIFQDEGIPFLSVDSIQNDKIIFKNTRFISKEDNKKYSMKCKPQQFDILFGKAASVGKVGFVETDKEFNIWSPLAVIRLKDEFEPKFYYYYMLSSSFQHEVFRYVNFNTQGNIGMKQIEKLLFISPPLEIQKSISNFLDKKIMGIDLEIMNNKKLSEFLKEKRNFLIDQTVTKGLDPKVPMKNSEIEGIGKIPEHWNLSKIKHYTTKINSGITPKGGSETYLDNGIPLIRSQNVHFDGLHLDNIAYISSKTNEQMKNSQIKDHDILLNITGASIGRCTYIPNNFGEGNVNQHVCIIRTSKEINYKYLTMFFTTSQIQSLINGIQEGASRQGLTFQNIKNFDLMVPPIEEQKQIIDLLDIKIPKINIAIKKTSSQIEKLYEYRKSMISSAVTGKIDVREVVA